MLLWLAEWLEHYFHFFGVIHYLTIRTIFSSLTAWFFVLWVGPKLIAQLRRFKVGQVVRDDGPQSHLSKTGTPTMGGILVLGGVTVSTILWGNLNDPYVDLSLFVMLAYGFVGGVDDFRKLILKHPKGLASRWKFFWQSVIAVLAAAYLYWFLKSPVHQTLIIPFLKDWHLGLGAVGFLLLTYFVLVGSSNAVNLTDGLDGLAILPTVLVAAALGVFAYVSGNYYFAEYLHLPFVAGAGELVVFIGAMVGGGLGFLWFNAYPAEVFMGDVGSLSLGATLGIIAVILRQEIVLFIMGGVFVLETLSVILQVASFKMTGKRIFRMAPLHHHFELKGWAEPKVIVRFWIITFVLVLCGLATLKLR